VNVKMLIVDDEDKVRDMLQRYFRSLGCEVDTAPNGRVALDLIGRVRYDILISDIMMPELDGVDLLRAVRQFHPYLHAIMMTGYVKQENVLACMRLGADNCVFKPLTDLTELRESVEDAVRLINRWRAKLAYLRTLKPDGENAP